ncbi:DUF1344 domain-containing protein [Hoeflea sp.]|uniref:DUF1344 domain-containing protein n=1 Tax=Hoeflea sp. TaxID=1940281 RepID=UPI002AFF3898|nr:DUF1344 domain-containing protein [Hoeflea sp.]
MRVFLMPLAVGAILAATFGAFAASTMTSGTVKDFSPKAQTLTLNDGTVYTLTKTFKDPGVKVGEKVEVSWTMQNSKHMADKVTIVH